MCVESVLSEFILNEIDFGKIGYGKSEVILFLDIFMEKVISLG